MQGTPWSWDGPPTALDGRWRGCRWKAKVPSARAVALSVNRPSPRRQAQDQKEVSRRPDHLVGGGQPAPAIMVSDKHAHLNQSEWHGLARRDLHMDGRAPIGSKSSSDPGLGDSDPIQSSRRLPRPRYALRGPSRPGMFGRIGAVILHQQGAPGLPASPVLPAVARGDAT